MSSLDKAFIRAYTKDAKPQPSHYESAAPAPTTVSPQTNQQSSLAAAGMYAEGAMYRLDESHVPGEQPPTQFPQHELPQTQYGTPYRGPLPLQTPPVDAPLPQPQVPTPVDLPHPNGSPAPLQAPQLNTLPDAEVGLLDAVTDHVAAAALAYPPPTPVTIPQLPAEESSFLAGPPTSVEAAPNATTPVTTAPVTTAPIGKTEVEAEPVESTPADPVDVPAPTESPQPTGAEEPVTPEPEPQKPADSESEPSTNTTDRPPAAPIESPQSGEDILRTASSIKLPQVLELPSVFESLAQDAENVSRSFAPDWEVDRFAWPEVCERLLKTEAKYFQQVGRRLRNATEDDHQVLLVSGCRRGEGRTTLALCMARCAADAGIKVALFDADFANPRLGSKLSVETPCGWLEVVDGKAPLNEAAISSVEDQLTLFPLNAGQGHNVQPKDERLLALLTTISSRYELVIVDSGPLGSEETHPFCDENSSSVNAAIVVRDLRYTTEKKVTATAEQLVGSGIEAVGIAENFRMAE